MHFTLIRIVSRILLFISLCCAPLTILADLPALPLSQPLWIIPQAPALPVKSFLLMDYLSDYVIAGQAMDERIEPASLTKMMTVYVIAHALKNGKITLQDPVKISKAAWKTGGSRMFVEINSTVPVEQLLWGIIVQSGNDASVALAEHIAGNEATFANLMNHYAVELGMVNSHFMNATGLPDPDHYTTARDMAILAKALIHDFPDIYAIHAQKEFTYQNIKQENRNRLLWQNALVDGIKTGFTEGAGYCMVASGQKNNMRLIAVVMGAKTDAIRIEETNKLLNYGFHFFETRKLYTAGTPIKKTRIWMGTEKEIELGLAKDLYVTIGQGQHPALKTDIEVYNIIKAPTQEGMVLGKLAVQLNNKVIAEHPIIALHEVPSGSVLSRLYDRAALMVHQLLAKISL